MSRAIRILVTLSMLAFTATAPAPVRGTSGSTLYVAYGDALDSGPGTSCSDPGYRSEDQLALYNALNDAEAGDTVHLCEGHWVFTNDGFYDAVPDNVTIQGLGAGRSVLDGNGSHYLLGITTGTGIVVRGITFHDGYEGSYAAGLYVLNAEVTVVACEFTENWANEYGAALSAQGSTVHVVSSHFQDNIAGFGAALVANDSTVTVTNSRFVENNATDGRSGYGGAAIYNWGGSVSITGSTFVDNETASTGAGVMGYLGPVTILNSSFVGNIASQGPAVYSYGDDSDVIIKQSRFIDNLNSAADDGGAVTFEHNNSDLVMENNLFQGNSGATYGGAAEIWNVSGSIRVIGNTFRDNSAVEGGALWIDIRGGTRDIQKNLFIGNRAAVGGAIAYECETIPARRATALLTQQNRFGRNVATANRRTSNVYDSNYGCFY
jgi:hypothetical protein